MTTQGNKPSKKKFKSYLIGYFYINIAEGKLYLRVPPNSNDLSLIELTKCWNETTPMLWELLFAIKHSFPGNKDGKDLRKAQV